MYRSLLNSTGAAGPEVTLLDRLLGPYIFTEIGDGHSASEHSQQQNKQENKMEALPLSTLTDADRADTEGDAWV